MVWYSPKHGAKPCLTYPAPVSSGGSHTIIVITVIIGLPCQPAGGATGAFSHFCEKQKKKFCCPFEGTLDHGVAVSHYITLRDVTPLFIIIFYNGWLQGIVHFIAEVSLGYWLVHVGQNVGFSFFFPQNLMNTSMFLIFMLPFSNSVFSPVSEGACP